MFGHVVLDPTLPRFQVGRAVLDPNSDPFSRRPFPMMLYDFFQSRDYMLLSDWSIQKILRSEWLPSVQTLLTTNPNNYNKCL